MSPKIIVNKESIAQFCQKNHIRKLALFGSVLTDQFGPDSDIDVLVEFDPDASVGFIAMASLEDELTELLGRKADLRTPYELSRRFRQKVLEQAQVQYES